MGYKNLKFDDNSVFLVTGGAGFIGSNLCDAIIELGYTVRCLDNLSTGNYDNIAHLENNDRFTFIKGDIRDLDTCMDACKGVDYVLNQAAWGSVPRSIEMPLLYEEINIRGHLFTHPVPLYTATILYFPRKKVRKEISFLLMR